MQQLVNFVREEIAVSAWKNCMLPMVCEQEETPFTLQRFLLQKVENFYPICAFSETIAEYDTQIESDLSVGLLAENEKESQSQEEESPEGDKQEETADGKEQMDKQKEKEKTDTQENKEQETVAEAAPEGGKAVEISREKLND